MSGRYGRNNPRVTNDGELLTLANIPAFENSVDAFGNFLARNTTNEADIGSQYNFTAERQRLYQNGDRVFIQYGEGGSIFNDTVDSFELTPAQGDVLKLTTAERFRYVVGYVIRPSFSYSLSRQLEEGDKVVIGYGHIDLENDMSSSDGWFFIYTPELKEDEVEIAEYRAGTKITSQIVKVNKAIDIWKRVAIWINWYNVGVNHYQETFTEKGKQFNPIIGSLSVDNGKGPESPNQRIELAIQRGSSSSPITLDVGSMGVETLGDVGVIKKQKISEHSYTFASGPVNNDQWVPMLAIRNDPNNPNVYNELLQINITEWDGSDDLRMAVQVHHKSKVLKSGDVELEDSDFEAPVHHTPSNSAIQISTAVEKAPNENGIPVLAVTNAGYGGYQIGWATTRITGSGNSRIVTNNNRSIKRSIHNGDIVVIWGRADNAESVIYELLTEQDW